jgi:N-formylglutamate amidohydrolase
MTASHLPDDWPRSDPPAGPVVVHVPHAGTDIPDDAGRSAARRQGLAAELAAMTDWHTDRLAADAVARAGVAATVFRNPLSRLVIDPERFPDEREAMRSRGMGAVYTRTSALEPLRADDPEQEATAARAGGSSPTRRR